MALLNTMLALICTTPTGVLFVTDPALLLLLRRISITFSYPVNLGLVMRVLAGIIVRVLRRKWSKTSKEAHWYHDELRCIARHGGSPM